jgi:hypothetical protein
MKKNDILLTANILLALCNCKPVSGHFIHKKEIILTP